MSEVSDSLNTQNASIEAALSRMGRDPQNFADIKNILILLQHDPIFKAIQ